MAFLHHLYILFVINTIFFIIQLIFSYLTHALILLLDAYQTLIYLCTLSGYIILFKYAENGSNVEEEVCIRNTFGWARIEIMSLMVSSTLLLSFSLSVIVEGLQSLIHISHLDEMHLPLPVLTLGICALILKPFSYKFVSNITINNTGHKILNSSTNMFNIYEFLSYIIAPILVVLTTALVYYNTNSTTAKYLDPFIAVLAAITLISFKYPTLKQSGLILLQTVPESINIAAFKDDVLNKFPGIINIHDFHMWQLTTNKIVSTLHVIFVKHQCYYENIAALENYFLNKGIIHVTIQPEFLEESTIADRKCMMMVTVPCLMK